MHDTHASPGLWALAWKRLRADRLAMAALAVVGLFLLMLVLSATGLIVAPTGRMKWASTTRRHPSSARKRYGRRHFIGAKNRRAANPFDPLADDIRQLKAETAGSHTQEVADPLAKEMALRASLAKTERQANIDACLPFGADKWGHDIIKKTIKGGETSIVVGLVAATLAVALGTLFGAFSGFYGGVVDDFFNWFYSIFTSIPSILMILTVAAVLQQKGVLTIVLILGLTGWTGPYRLIRAEYIKHKAREYVMAADAIGASKLAQDVLAYLPQREPRGAGAAVDPGGRLHQGRSDPELPRLRRAGGRGVLGQHAERGAERTDTRQMVATDGGCQRDGGAGNGVLAVHRCAARCTRSETEVIWIKPSSKCATCASASASTRRTPSKP
jgi:peptide/nickel transport system permease protein